jgi:ribonuclease HI
MGVEHEPVEIIGDARSVIDQMVGLAGVNAPQARVLNQRARRIARHFQALTWVWQPRRNNLAADQLTRRALRQVHSDRQSIRQALLSALGPRRGMTALFDLCVFSNI